MSLFRLVIAWLVMAALPLQGLAAGAMLFCEQAAHATVVAQPAGHDHAAHGHGDAQVHAQASHAHEGHGMAQADASVDSGAQPVDAPQAGAGMADDGHACPICAACCNLVALSEAPSLSLPSGAHAAPAPQGAARVLTRASPAPDKPPRA